MSLYSGILKIGCFIHMCVKIFYIKTVYVAKLLISFNKGFCTILLSNWGMFQSLTELAQSYVINGKELFSAFTCWVPLGISSLGHRLCLVSVQLSSLSWFQTQAQHFLLLLPYCLGKQAKVIFIVLSILANFITMGDILAFQKMLNQMV